MDGSGLQGFMHGASMGLYPGGIPTFKPQLLTETRDDKQNTPMSSSWNARAAARHPTIGACLNN